MAVKRRILLLSVNFGRMALSTMAARKETSGGPGLVQRGATDPSWCPIPICLEDAVYSKRSRLPCCTAGASIARSTQLNGAREKERSAMDVVGSVMTEQGVTFAVVQVQGYKVETPQEAEETIQAYAPLFPGLPVVVMAVGAAGRPTTFWGRDDLANFMSGVHPASLAWRVYRLARGC